MIRYLGLGPQIIKQAQQSSNPAQAITKLAESVNLTEGNPEALRADLEQSIGKMGETKIDTSTQLPEQSSHEPVQKASKKGKVQRKKPKDQANQEAKASEEKAEVATLKATEVNPDKNTWYLDEEALDKIAEFQSLGKGKKKLYKNGDNLVVEFTSGPHKGKSQVLSHKESPEIGLIPVEAWNGGQKVNFGKKITSIEKPKTKPKSTPKESTQSANKPAEDLSSIGKMGTAISDNFYRDTFKAIQQGKTTLSGGKDSFMEAAKINYDKGLIKSENDLRQFRKAWDEKFNKKQPTTES